jgi:hypothetical protein
LFRGFFVRIFKPEKNISLKSASRRGFEYYGAKDSILLLHCCPRIPSLVCLLNFYDFGTNDGRGRNILVLSFLFVKKSPEFATYKIGS